MWGLNEIETTWQRLLLATVSGYGLWPLTGNPASVPIMWDKRVLHRIPGSGVRTLAHHGVAHYTPTRYINELQFEPVKGGPWFPDFTFLCTHGVNLLEVGGLPRPEPVPGWHDLAKAMFAKLAERIRLAQERGPVVFVGDLNVNLYAEQRLAPADRCPWFPLTMLGGLLQPSSPPPGGSTESRRAIDWTMTSGFDVLEHVSVPLGAQPQTSDHRAQVLTLLSKKKPPPPPPGPNAVLPLVAPTVLEP